MARNVLFFPCPRPLAPYEPYHLRRWKEGCHNGVTLWQVIKEQAFAYTVTNVSRFLAHWRREGKPPHPVWRTGSSLSTPHGPIARRVAFLCSARSEDLEEEDVVYLERLRTEDASVARAAELVQEFMTMLHERQGELIDDWIEQAKTSGIDERQRVAPCLDADHEAVQAGLTVAWSQGQVEGVRRVTQLWVFPTGEWNWKGGFRVTRLTPRRKAARTRAWRESGSDGMASRVGMPQDPRPMSRA